MPRDAATFEPPLGLRNPHLQSMLASLMPRRWFVARSAGQLTLRRSEAGSGAGGAGAAPAAGSRSWGSAG